MAKGEQRGNREAKKPKAVKPKPPAGATSIANVANKKPETGAKTKK